uniref:Complex1_LYR_dom domain-containing protein n=1 Tax=Strongyloides papillosus TaxID=174720 RepID=A0A0N5C860_STREA
MSRRPQVLSLFKKFIKLGRKWEATNSLRTSIEREDFLREIRNVFRQNKFIKDDAKIDELILEGEKRYYLAETYKTPYDRPSYLPPSSSYYGHGKSKTLRVRVRRPDGEKMVN